MRFFFRHSRRKEVFRPADILPATHAPRAALAVVTALMCYLSGLALGGALMIDSRFSAWSAQVQREITVELHETGDTPSEEQRAIAKHILNTTPGVLEVRELSKAETARLLTPWLGETPLLTELPIPTLIAVTLDRRALPDIEALAGRLKAEVEGIHLDTHERWMGELSASSIALSWLVAFILLINISAMATLVIYAARAAVEANRGVIETLYFIGARDWFISRQIAGRFFSSGLRSAALGTGASLVTIAVLALSDQISDTHALAQTAREPFWGPIDMIWPHYAVFAAVAVLVALLTWAVAHITIMRMLRAIF